MSRRSWPLALPTLGLIALFVLLPLLSVVRYAGWEWSGFGPPEAIGFGNLARLLRDRDFGRSLLTTVVFAALVLPAFLWLSRTLAVAITGSRLEGAIKALLLLPALTTVAGSAVSWYLLYNPNYGLLMELTGLALPWDRAPWAAMAIIVLFSLWQNTGYGVVVMSAALRRVPTELFEAAHIDGADDGQTLRLVVFPLLRPALLFLSVIGSVLALQSYTAVYLLTRGGPFGSTRVVGYYIYETAFERLQLGYGAALTLAVLAFALAVAGLQLALGARRRT